MALRRSERRRAFKRRLLDLVDQPVLDIDFVSAVAGDRDLEADEKRTLTRMRRQRGLSVYSDFLFAVTHFYFDVSQAKQIWENILEHRDKMKDALGRNPGITLAAFDYLVNIEKLLDSSIIIPQDNMEIVAEVALKDGLTGLFDQTSFHNLLEKECTRFKRYGTKFSLIMMDLDNFKHFNDTKGHLEGDKLLIEFAKILKQEIREMDVACRTGGEEFSIILPHTGMESALKIAERIREEVELKFRDNLHTTVSIGVSNCPEHTADAEDLIRNADAALYESKRHGKNQVTPGKVS